MISDHARGGNATCLHLAHVLRAQPSHRTEARLQHLADQLHSRTGICRAAGGGRRRQLASHVAQSQSARCRYSEWQVAACDCRKMYMLIETNFMTGTDLIW